MRSTALIALFACFLAPMVAPATDHEARSIQQFNAWTSAVAHVQLTQRWWFVPELHWRRADGLGHHLQEGLLLAPEYRTGRFSVQPGYAFWRTHPYGEFRTPATQHEHRSWLQVGYKHPLGAWQLDHRLRTEQRFIERHQAHPEGPLALGYKYVGRLRYRARVVAPLNNKNGKAGELQAIVQKELMVRHGDSTFKGLFDQMRPAVQLGYRPWEHLQITAGYQLQYLVRGNGFHEEWDHTLMVGAFWRMPFNDVRKDERK